MKKLTGRLFVLLLLICFAVPAVAEAGPEDQRLREAALAMQQGNLEKSLKLTREIEASNPNNPGVFFLRSGILDSQGEHAEAIQSIDRAIELNPKNPDYYEAKGMMLFEAKSFAEAQDSLSAAIKRSPENPVLFLKRGMAYGAGGKETEAQSDFQAAIKLDAQILQKYPHVANLVK